MLAPIIEVAKLVLSIELVILSEFKFHKLCNLF